MKGIIFSIKRYAVHDGPGIRVTFYMKGCPLSCWWCHNPEGISPHPEEIVQTTRVGEKEFLRRTLVGKSYEVRDIISILEKERVFIENSGGGVTFSGGEPVMQHQFLTEALQASHENGIHTAVDTAGHYPAARLKKVLPFTDLFLFDLKHPGATEHKYYTGVSNRLILSNLRLILESGKETMIRIPVIPGINDAGDTLEGFLEILNNSRKDKINMINLLPYHRTGSSKYRKFSMPYRMENFKPPSDSRMKDLSDLFSSAGIRVKVGG